MPKRSYKDILLWPDEQKDKLYDRIERLYLDGILVKTKEHKSGFPAITIDVEAKDAHIHVITDCLSAEKWRAEHPRERR